MEVKEINNKKIWESFIKNTSPQSFFQSWDWGEITKRTNDNKISFIGRYGLYRRNTLLGIFQIQKIKALRGSFLQIRHGPIFEKYNKNNFNILINFIKKLIKTENASFLRISPLILPTAENLDFFKTFGFKDSPIHALDGEYCWVLELDKKEEDLLNAMRKTTRYLIRKAQKEGVIIIKSSSQVDFEEFMKLYSLTSKRHKFVKHKGLKQEFEVLLKSKSALLFKGFYQNKLISIALIIFYQNQAIYHHSASIEQKVPVNYLLQWEAIKEAKIRGSKIYNFWGIAPLTATNHPWKNLTLFKMGFGGRVVEYLHSQDYPINRIEYYKTYIIESVRKFTKGY